MSSDEYADMIDRAEAAPFTHPIDPANGRFLCSTNHPMPKDAPPGSRWAHTNIDEGEQEDDWPSGDTVRCRCRDCGATWTMELPQ